MFTNKRGFAHFKHKIEKVLTNVFAFIRQKQKKIIDHKKDLLKKGELSWSLVFYHNKNVL